MKKTISILLVIACLVCSFAACGKPAEEEDPYKDYVKLERYCEKVMETKVYTELKQDWAYEKLTEEFDQYAVAGGCTAVAKGNIPDGMIIGRNMDLYITDKPSYIVRTDVPGFKKTIGLTYNPVKSESFEKVLEHGVNPDFYEMLPFFQTDVLNEDGFYIEVNMRCTEYDADGNSVFTCTGTNPGKERVFALLLPQYIGSRCSTVDEALQLAESLDIYTGTPGGSNDWNFCFMLADASGKYGVLEIAQNKLFFNEAVARDEGVMPLGAAQANYYITPELYAQQTLKAGVGRIDYLRNKWPEIDCEERMYQAINFVTYYQAYLPICQYDNATEFIGYYDEDGEIFIGSKTPDVMDGETVVWDYDYVTNPENKKYIDAYIAQLNQKLTGRVKDGSLEEIAQYWESTYTVITNCTNKTMFVRFNENNKSLALLGFDN